MERQTISRFIRQNLAGLLVGVTLGAVSMTALTATTGTFSGAVSTTALTASTGDITATAGNIVATAGNVNAYSGTISGGNVTAFPGTSTIGPAWAAVVAPSADWVNVAPSSTSEEVLKTLTFQANTLTNEARVRVRAWGIAAANANSKIVRLRINGLATTIVGACTFANAGDTTWTAEWLIWRTGASTQATFVVCDGAATDAQATSTAAQTDTAAFNPTITVQNATAGSDLTLKGVVYEINE